MMIFLSIRSLSKDVNLFQVHPFDVQVLGLSYWKKRFSLVSVFMMFPSFSVSDWSVLISNPSSLSQEKSSCDCWKILHCVKKSVNSISKIILSSKMTAMEFSWNLNSNITVYSEHETSKSHFCSFYSTELKNFHKLKCGLVPLHYLRLNISRVHMYADKCSSFNLVSFFTHPIAFN